MEKNMMALWVTVIFFTLVPPHFTGLLILGFAMLYYFLKGFEKQTDTAEDSATRDSALEEPIPEDPPNFNQIFESKEYFNIQKDNR